MPMPVVTGAMTKCAFGTAPSTLVVLPTNRVMMEKKPAANIGDNKPFVNIMPFGTCMSLANPQTASLTSAALGVLTPGPCTPIITTPWIPGTPKTMVGPMPALTMDSTCMCGYGGVIQITAPGTATEQIG